VEIFGADAARAPAGTASAASVAIKPAEQRRRAFRGFVLAMSVSQRQRCMGPQRAAEQSLGAVFCLQPASGLEDALRLPRR